jgi:DNA polymerase-3 subunit epsilon
MWKPLTVNVPLTANFVAIDFETADYTRDSACALGLVRVEEGRIVERASCLIRPPRPHFSFTRIHGITWAQVADQPSFGEVWPELVRLLDGAVYLAAHNAAFDRGVLTACCGAAGLKMPTLPFVCTLALARRTWGLYPAGLRDVCAYLRLPLKHHDAASDAEACAGIILEVCRRSAGPGGELPARRRIR